MKTLKIFISTLAAMLFFTSFLFAQNVFESGLRLKLDSLRREKEVGFFGNGILLPNGSVQSVMTPSGWGGGNTTYLYVVVGGIYPAEYATPKKADLITAAGLSFGDPKKYVNTSLSVNVGRVSELQDLSANIILSKQIFKASSISVGGIQLFASSSISDAPDATFYVAFSHSVQTVSSKSTGRSALGYTIGVGNGRFLYKSPKDIASGKGKYGTGVFANVSYELFKNMNINAEWSGLNLGFSSGLRPFSKSPLTLGYGVYNLTRNSGDRVSFIGTLAYPFILDKKVNY
ncbi:hypothetical protein FA048_02420 [Pedobacter polaris]|uniref:Uncharacterized protein n=1 Tax=Pedobacter polaris TaxID=2571273 RepID=A0A4U1CUH1_9SPHI|nr:hypothetical protein [Pedobacter polaris]TKC12493.1 hypothetical protein FA048_02420 [Pedobacter polaris]